MKAIIATAVLAAAAVAFAANASADDVTVKVFRTAEKGQGEALGTVRTAAPMMAFMNLFSLGLARGEPIIGRVGGRPKPAQSTWN